MPPIAKKRIAPPIDPLAPLTETQLQGRARADINARVNPILENIRRTVAAHTKAGMGAISGYTGQLAQNLLPYEGKAADIYGDAAQSTASVNDALLQNLRGQGTDLSAQLSGKLGQINAPGAVIDQVAGGAAQTGAGASGALHGIGSAALNEIIARGASARDYAAKLPGIARFEGLQSGKELQLASGRSLTDQLGKVAAEVPGMVQDLYKDYRGAEIDKQITKIAGRSEAETARIEAQARAREQAADRAFELSKLRQQQQFEATQAKLDRDSDLAEARREFQRSQRSDADKRRWQAKQDEIKRRFTAKQNELNRKAAAANAKKAGGGLVP